MNVYDLLLFLTPPALVVVLCVVNATAFVLRFQLRLLAVRRQTLLLLALSMLLYAFAYVVILFVDDPFTIEVRVMFRLSFVAVLTALSVANISAVSRYFKDMS